MVLFLHRSLARPTNAAARTRNGTWSLVAKELPPHDHRIGDEASPSRQGEPEDRRRDRALLSCTPQTERCEIKASKTTITSDGAVDSRLMLLDISHVIIEVAGSEDEIPMSSCSLSTPEIRISLTLLTGVAAWSTRFAKPHPICPHELRTRNSRRPRRWRPVPRESRGPWRCERSGRG